MFHAKNNNNDKRRQRRDAFIRQHFLHFSLSRCENTFGVKNRNLVHITEAIDASYYCRNFLYGTRYRYKYCTTNDASGVKASAQCNTNTAYTCHLVRRPNNQYQYICILGGAKFPYTELISKNKLRNRKQRVSFRKYRDHVYEL